MSRAASFGDDRRMREAAGPDVSARAVSGAGPEYPLSPWVARAALGLALVGLAGLTRLWADGDASFVGLAGALPAAVVTLVLGSLAVGATMGGGLRRSPVVLTGLRVLALILLAGSCFLLLDLIQLVIDGRVTSPDGQTHWLAFAERLLCGTLGVLFLVIAAAHTVHRCPECGRCHVDEAVRTVKPPATAAGPALRRIALAGCVGFVPYLGIHGAHAAGLAPELDSLYEPHGIFPVPPLAGWLLFVVFLIGPAVFLLQGLVRRWGVIFPRWIPWIGGRRVPRYLPVVPACIVAPTLALYGFGSIVYAWVIHASLLGLGGAASLAFGCYGTTLGVAALAYQRRTRPVRLCPAAAGPR